MIVRAQAWRTSIFLPFSVAGVSSFLFPPRSAMRHSARYLQQTNWPCFPWGVVVAGSLVAQTDKQMGDFRCAGAPGKGRGMGPGGVEHFKDQQVMGKSNAGAILERGRRTYTQPTQLFAAGAQLAAHTKPALRSGLMAPTWRLLHVPRRVTLDLTWLDLT